MFTTGTRPVDGTTQYLYGNPGNPFQLTASRSADNTLTTYSYDTSGNLFAFERAGTRFYVATDHLGTPKVVTDNTGAVVKQTEYDAWGVKLSDSAPAFDLPVGFAGGIPESTTGLVRFGFRDYEPGTGRWVAKDPILFGSGQGNLYSYAGNRPTTNKDSSGLINVALGALGAGIGGATGAISTLIYTPNASFSDVLIGAGTGATFGFTAGFTMGGSVIGTAIVGSATGMVSDMVGQSIGNLHKCKGVFEDIDYDSVVVSGIAGLISGGGGQLAIKGGATAIDALIVGSSVGSGVDFGLRTAFRRTYSLY